MTKPPADWYDDPEDSLQYRYWDGDQWSEHRAPKVATRAPGAAAASAWSVFPQTFRLAISRWQEAIVLSIPLILGQLLGGWLVYRGLNQVFYGRLSEIFDRITEPGFDPTSGADQTFIENIEARLPVSAVWQTLLGVAIVTIVSLVVGLALSRLYVGANGEVAVSASDAMRAAIRRAPRAAGYWLLIFVAWAVAAIVVLLLGLLVPPLLILTIPASIVLAIWLLPYFSIFNTSLAVGPIEQRPPAIATAAVRGRWWWVFRRWLVLMVTIIVASLAPGIAANAALYISFVAYLIVTTINQAIQATIGAAGNAEIYRLAGAAVDPALVNSGSDDTAP